MGTLTLPGTAADKPYSVFLFLELGELPEEEVSGRTTGGSISYAFGAVPAVPAGSYFLLGFVDVDSSGFQMSTTGDYRGWYGHGGDGEAPSAPNVEVPESGSVTYDWALVVAP